MPLQKRPNDMRRLPAITFLMFAALMAGPEFAWADRIGDIAETTMLDQAKRFFSFKDPSVRYAIIGAILLGISCGLMGGFIVVRRMALFGDTLSHAVLPGVALGFLWNMSKDPVAIFVGATVAGLIGGAMVTLIRQTTRLKEDTALGLVLASFFAVGICFLTRIQKMPGNKGGLDDFLFGSTAVIGRDDIILMALVTTLAVLFIGLFYKELLVTSFDASFARAAGFPVNLIHYALMLLLAFSVVVALQAVGVVLVSAMLITPAAAAYLLTDRMHRLLGLAALFGVIAGVVGAFLSFLKTNLPTGPLMVMSATLVFVLAFLFGPRHGIVMRWWRQKSRSARVQRENTLKAVYHVLEARDFDGEGVSLRELAERRRETIDDVRIQSNTLSRHDLATLHEDGNSIHLTPDGWQRACEIVRNHRLWELYLTNEAQIAPDHVHDDAEEIEHVLGEETVREIERTLNHAKEDPHGRPIPGLADLTSGSSPFGPPETAIGYGNRL